MGFTLRIGSVGAFCALTACAEITGFGAPATLTNALPLYDGSVVAVAPEGYCVATRSSRPRSGFAVLAACDAISGGQSRPDTNGFITVQVGALGSALSTADADTLEDLLNSDAGRGLLSQTGSADEITIRVSDQTGETVTVEFADAAAPPVGGLQSTEWRGFLTANGRLATVSVRGFAAAPLISVEGQTLLESTIRAIQSGNVAPQTATDS